MKIRQPRKWPSAKRIRYKKHLYSNQNGKCFICGRPFDFDKLRFRQRTGSEHHILICGGCYETVALV